MSHRFVSLCLPFASLLIIAGLLPVAGCSDDRQPAGEVIEIETIEIIEPEDSALPEPVEESPPPPSEPPANASS